ncbi:MAG: hypothetical protein J7647_05050 [Cyanobacteria bacterium SBLK]|nr:hypothetical protein [Cyanobacteria bacterium SBLK]
MGVSRGFILLVLYRRSLKQRRFIDYFIKLSHRSLSIQRQGKRDRSPPKNHRSPIADH